MVTMDWHTQPDTFKEIRHTWDIPAAVSSEIAKSIGRWGVSCSGGCDSVCAVLWALAYLGAERLVVIHFDHGLRGVASEDDARWVQALSATLGVACLVGQGSVDSSASEAQLREQRQAFVAEIVRQERLEGVITGHHAGDVLETVLLRLLRQSSVEGLAAPRPLSCDELGTKRLRPLLGKTKADLEAFLQQIGLDWREDQSNADAAYARNFIRAKVIPQLSELAEREGRNLSSAVGGFRELMEDVGEVFDWAIGENFKEKSVSLATLHPFPKALKKAYVGRWIQHHTGAYPERRLLAKIVADYDSDSLDQQLSSTWRIAAEDGEIQLLAKDKEYICDYHSSLPVGAETHCPWVGYFEVELLGKGSGFQEEIRSKPINPMIEAIIGIDSECVPSFSLRPRRPGDTFHAMGAPGKRKLKDVFIDKKIPLRERDEMPIVVDGTDRMVWRPGFPPAEAWKVLSHHNHALRLTYRPR